MDSSNITTLIIINVILNFIQLIDRIFSRLKSSKCFGSELQFNNSKDLKDDKDQSIPIKFDNELIKQLEAFAISNKKDDPVNKLQV
jgi:hypothetical protein